MWRVQGFVGRGERIVIDVGETPLFNTQCVVVVFHILTMNHFNKNTWKFVFITTMKWLART